MRGFLSARPTVLQVSTCGARDPHEQSAQGILSVIETATKHLDASQILRKAQKGDASVDRRSVYRTLDLLKRQGLIDELDGMHLNGEGNYYDRKLGQDHIHRARPATRSFQQVSSHRGRHPRSDLEARGTMYSVVACVLVPGSESRQSPERGRAIRN